jgi:S-adenosylmethionine-diacylglycerol 3-amino-3-carboxypropyl transferase
MKKKIEGQVPLSKLIFCHNWEDPGADEKVLQIQKGDRLFAITSGGCNVLGFLRFEPASIHCVDINPAQNHLMELKKAAFRRFDFNQFSAFMGLHPSEKRLSLYNLAVKDLSPEARKFWDENRTTIENGLIMNGRYEKFIKLAGKLIRIIQGTEKTRMFFHLNTLEEQAHFFESKWNNARWKFIFNLLFNKKRLSKRGLNAEYFHFDDGSLSFSESFQKRAAHAFKDLPAKSNYFLALYLLGHYLNDREVPEYLKEENFDIIKSNIDRIQTTTADSKYWLELQKENMFDGFALSNICELMDEKDTLKLFEQVARTGRDGSKIIFRNLMIPREVPESMRSVIRKDEALSKAVQYADRSFVYGKVAAYSVNKH